MIVLLSALLLAAGCDQPATAAQPSLTTVSQRCCKPPEACRCCQPLEISKEILAEASYQKYLGSAIESYRNYKNARAAALLQQVLHPEDLIGLENLPIDPVESVKP